MNDLERILELRKILEKYSYEPLERELKKKNGLNML